MGGFVDGIKGMFGIKSKTQKEAELASAQARDSASLAQARAGQEALDNKAGTGAQMASIGKVPRGSRLLLGGGDGASTLGRA